MVQKSKVHEMFMNTIEVPCLSSKFVICVLQDRIVLITALSPQLEQLAADTRSLGAVPSLKDNIVVVSAHHASTLQQLENTKDELSKGILAKY